MDKTLGYYEKNGQQFANETNSVDFTQTQDRFLEKIHKGGLILDFGCGAGRDSKYFLQKGFQVDSIDGSSTLCNIASKQLGILVRQMLFQELDAIEEYDGIWACASILHLPKDVLVLVFGKMAQALKEGGVLYASFKYGDFEGERDGRYFTNMTEQSFAQIRKEIPRLCIVEQWVSSDVRPGREEEKWFNVIMRK